MKKLITVITVLIILSVVGSFVWGALANKANLKTTESPWPAAFHKAFLAINDGTDIKNFEVDFKEGATVFDILKSKTDELNINLKSQAYDTGVLIQAIGGVENGQNGKYWMYYINGALAPVAADKENVKLGDKIEFKFENSPF